AALLVVNDLPHHSVVLMMKVMTVHHCATSELAWLKNQCHSSACHWFYRSCIPPTIPHHLAVTRAVIHFQDHVKRISMYVKWMLSRLSRAHRPQDWLLKRQFNLCASHAERNRGLIVPSDCL